MLPDLAAMLAVATLAYCLFVRGASDLFRDSDAGWHIRNGESILLNRALPRTDPYSFSKSGEPWIAWEWGSDVLMGFAHGIGGLRAVAAMFAVAIATCTWLWTRLAFNVGGDFFLTALLSPIMVTTASLHWLARPHVFGWIFLLISLIYLQKARRVSWIGVAAFSAVWANLHASFFLGPIVALAYFAGTRRADYLKIAAAALLGSLVNPYGWNLHAHVVSYLRDEELTSRIAEFQSFNFHDPTATQIALTMAIAAAGVTLALTQRKYAHFAIGAMLWFGALRSARIIPLVALAVLPFANGAISDAIRTLTPLKYSAGMLAIDRRVNGAVFLIVTGSLLLLALRAQLVQFLPSQYPVQSAAAIANLPENARIASSDHFGGYLIYKFNGARKVFFDGRSDFYGAGFMKQYFVLNTARPGWREIVRRYQFTHALLPNDSALGDALAHDGWRTIAHDPVATLLEAP